MADGDTRPIKKKKKKKKRSDLSIGWVVMLAMIVVAVIGWGCMASHYVHVVENYDPTELDTSPGPRRLKARAAAALITGFVAFIANIFTQLPNLFAVIGQNLRHNQGLMIGLVVVEALIFLGGMWMTKLEADLKKPSKYGRERPPD